MSSGSVTIGNIFSKQHNKHPSDDRSSSSSSSDFTKGTKKVDNRFERYQPLVELKWYCFLCDFKLFGDDGMDVALSLGDFGVSAFNANSKIPYVLVASRKVDENTPVFQVNTYICMISVCSYI
jgi:hypothetical protein